ncbi:hypothetical protein BGX21_001051 [Mortierella sp. AD011]|nr:hypothetical protein BGX20_009428 [Mortierella sp. AD010]KAF9401649.1 hypothetical protein BGX21_001051 [Mortierella sp. AD011]
MAPKSRETVNSDIELSDDEGVIKNLDYKPPKDFSIYKARKHTVSAFDVDEAAQHELWLIRVPEGISNEDLATMSLTLPTSTSTSPKEKHTLGTLKKKEVSSNSSSTTTKYQLQTVSPDSGFAGEMMALQPLVPDASKEGRLVQAPLGFHQHLALVAQPSIPSGAPLAEEILARPIPKREQPEGLKMRFKVSGFDTQVPGTKLSGSGKEFAANWAKVLEKRQKDQEEELLRAQQAMEAMEAEDEAENEAENEVEEVDGEIEDNADEVAVAVEEEEEKSELPAKKRKVESMDVDASESKKVKKDKKDKKDKKEKKEKKAKKEKN